MQWHIIRRPMRLGKIPHSSIRVKTRLLMGIFNQKIWQELLARLKKIRCRGSLCSCKLQKRYLLAKDVCDRFIHWQILSYTWGWKTEVGGWWGTLVSHPLEKYHVRHTTKNRATETSSSSSTKDCPCSMHLFNVDNVYWRKKTKCIIWH